MDTHSSEDSIHGKVQRSIDRATRNSALSFKNALESDHVLSITKPNQRAAKERLYKMNTEEKGVYRIPVSDSKGEVIGFAEFKREEGVATITHLDVKELDVAHIQAVIAQVEHVAHEKHSHELKVSISRELTETINALKAVDFEIEEEQDKKLTLRKRNLH